MFFERINFSKVAFCSTLLAIIAPVFSKPTPFFSDPVKQMFNEKNKPHIIFSYDNILQLPNFRIGNNSSQDPEKGFMPYIAKTYTINGEGKAHLKGLRNSRIISANDEQKKFILDHFSDFLTEEFQTIFTTDRSAGLTFVKFKIYCFRKYRGDIQILLDAEPDYELSYNSENKEARTASNTTLSVLSGGTWYKIGVTQTGIYKLNKTVLNLLGIQTGTLNPKNIRIYGTSTSILPEKNSIPRPDDLSELAIYVHGENDNVFDNSDYVLFFAKGPQEWKLSSSNSYSYEANLYTDTNYYFLNVDIGPGQRINSIDNQSLTANVSTNSYDYYNFHEQNTVNFLKSGREFFGEYFDFVTSYGFSFNDDNFVTGDSLKLFCAVAGRHSASNTYAVSCGTLSATLFCPGIPISVYSNYAIISGLWMKGLNTMPQNISVSISKNTPQAVAWLDKIIINTRRYLFYNNKPFCFRDSRVIGVGNICSYSLQSSSGIPKVWNVSNPLQPFELVLENSGSSFSFKYPSSVLEEFCVFRPEHVPLAYPVGRVPNQNIHAIQNIEYLIITHPKFLSEAQEIAQIHIQNDQMATQVVTTDKIYNEFGSGRPEATAIRDFIRMVYQRGQLLPNKLKYVLLVGRGSVFNKNGRAGNTNFIPTYQSWESLNPLGSVTTDDFFGLMDNNEGEFAETLGSVDIGIGRIVCSTTEEARAVVNKIKTYYVKDGLKEYEQQIQGCNDVHYSVMGEWRNHLIFSADDGDNALHMADADDINSFFKDFPEYIVHKIYIDAYKGVSTPGGKRYPDMQTALNNRINRGCLLFNYTGHGGEVGLAAERVVDIPIIQSWKNAHGLPLFVTATCEFSRYDDPDRISAGELCLLNPNGGAIALLTTCRLAFSSTNKLLNQKVLNHMMDFSSGKPRLGDIIRKAKAELFQSAPFANFHLLGDPALMLAYPEHRVVIDSLNQNILNPNDTLKGMQKITVSGKIVNQSMQPLTGFNGYATLSLYDKKNKIVCLLNDPGSSISNSGQIPFSFYSQNNKLLEVRSKVTQGRFHATFVVPKNLLPGFDKSKISVYATNGTTDAHGADTSLFIGGISNNPVTDNTGPEIKLYLNDERFVNGGMTGSSPVLMAHIFDSTGVNISGLGFGNDLKVTLNQTDQRVLNQYYIPETGSHQRGKLRYKFEQLKE
ncbi:MAG: type IX secretion system sortase PorU, partial [Bacteroidia bacterium]|nr:type IX secretion system sortase PorU [Bacteroidia bacterium]